MKYFVKFFVITFVLFASTYVTAEEKIVFLDMKQVLNASKAGKGAQDYLQKIFKDGQKKYSAEEAKLKKEEGDLLAQKTILSKEEYKKKSDSLREKVIKYQNSRRKSLDDIAEKRAKARTDLIKKLTPLIENYTKEKGILLIIDKEDIIAGNPALDITKTIIEKLNKELPSLNLK
jgi:Skp family chaperone for outer membrane proteins